MKFHNDDDVFIAIGGPCHGQLLQHYHGTEQTHVYINRPLCLALSEATEEELLKPIHYDTYRLRTFGVGPRRMQYFVLDGLGNAEAIRLINQFENDEETKVARR